MRYCVYYWIVEPLRGGIRDNDSREVSISTDINWKGEQYYFALVCDEGGVPEFARLDIPCKSGEQIPEASLPLITIVKEHLLSTLRLTWRDDARLFPMNCWRFWDDGDPRKFNIEIDMQGEETNFDVKAASAIFQNSMHVREEFRLFIDGIDHHIPPQYRFLAFYKLLEIRFKRDRTWDRKALSKTLEVRGERYQDLSSVADLVKELHSIRDKCAHIRIGKGKREVLGVTQLNHEESVRVHRILPLLREVCRDIMNERLEGRVVLGSCEPWYERLRHNKAVEATPVNNGNEP